MRKLLIFATLLTASCAAQTRPATVISTMQLPTAVAATAAAPTATPTAEPYAGLSINALSGRGYGGGSVFDLGVLGEYNNFSRRLISYQSDGLTINGFMDIPSAAGSRPVILLLHGYVDPIGYQVENYTARYAARFADAGYIVIHPNYRNYPPSEFGPNEFRVGFAIDVLNLIAIVNQQAGQAGLLQAADPNAVFLWGHSMGGGIALRILTVGADVQGAVLYGSMSGDERRNFEQIRDVISDGERGNDELSVSDEVLLNISPIFFYERISIPVSIHHGDIDDVVPQAWSQELCGMLQAMGEEVECFTYHNMPHTFYGDNDELLIQRSLDFFLRHMPGN